MLVKKSWISVYGCVSDLNQTSFEVSRHHDFNESGNSEHMEMMRCIVPFFRTGKIISYRLGIGIFIQNYKILYIVMYQMR